jgi:hypothetical protein
VWSGQHSIWYRWQAPSDGTVLVDTNGTDFDNVLAVYTGTSLDALTQVGFDSYPYDPDIHVRFSATAGTTYMIAVDSSWDTGQISLHLTEHDPPANDDFAGAQPLTGSSATATGSTNFATAETQEPGPSATASVWYSWTAPSDGIAIVDTAGSNFNTYLGIYTGDALPGPLAWVAANDDDTVNPGGTSRVAFRATAGTTYRIQVDSGGWAKTTGEVKLALRLVPPPANDDLANAVNLGGAATAAASGGNAGATGELGEPSGMPMYYCYSTPQPSTVWYRWTAPRRGSLTIRANAKFHAALATYTGSTVGALTRVANQPQAYDGGSEQIRIRVEAGTTYSIAVDTLCGEVGADFDLSLALTDSPANDDLANAAKLTGTSADVDGTNSGATQETCEPVHDDNHYDPSVWYTWTAPASGGVSLKVSGSLNGVIGVYTGTDLCALARVPSARLDSGHERHFHAVAGTTYRIAVDGVGAQQAAFHLALRESAPPANDDLAHAASLGQASTAWVAGTNAWSSSEQGEPMHYGYWCNGNVFQRSVWYRWTAPKSGSLTIRTAAGFQTVLAAYTGDTVATLTRVANQPQQYNGGSEQIRVRVVSGVTYDIAVASYCIAGDGPFSLALSLSDSPPNDDFENAAALTGMSAEADGTNVNATQQDCEPVHDDNYYDPSTWYRWTAPQTGSVTLEVGGELNGAIGVYTGVQVCGLTRVASARLDNGHERRFHADAGVTYWIAVDGVAGDQKPFHLTLDEVLAPANDAFAAAVDLGGAATASANGTNKGASAEPNEPSHQPYHSNCYPANPGSSVWYRWTAPKSGSLSVKATAAFNSQIAVYTGSAVGSLTGVAPERTDGSAGTARVRVAAGTPYSIAVDSRCGQPEGTFALDLALADLPANDDFANAIELTGSNPGADGTTAGATEELNEPRHDVYQDASVWYSWTAPATGGATVEVSDFPFGLAAVYTGDSLDKLARVPSTRVDEGAKRHFATVAGTRYWIAVDNSIGKQGPFHLSIRALPRPANDDFAAAEELTGSSDTAIGDNIGATGEQGDPNPGGSDANSVWYSWTAPAGGRATLEFTGNDFGGLFGVYTGDAVDSLTKVGGEVWGNWLPISFRATKGTTYRIAVYGYDAIYRGEFAFKLDLTSPPPNDDLANALELTGSSDAADGTTAGGTREPGEPSKYNAYAHASTWYRWTAPADGRVVIDSFGSAITTTLAAYSGSSVDALTPLAGQNGGSPEYNAKTDFLAKAGETYYISVDGYMPNDTGAYKLALEENPTPPNDDLANAERLTGSVAAATGTTVGAGHEANEFCCLANVTGDGSIWYRWRAPADGVVTVDTAGSNFNTGLAALTGPGTSVDGLTRVTQNDDAPSPAGTKQSEIQFGATAGTVYWLIVDGDHWSRPSLGNVQLHLRQGTAPANDDFANATTLTGDTTWASGSNAGATAEPGEPQHAGKPGGASVWYRWTATDDGPATVTTTGSRFDTLLGIYTGDAVGSLAQVAANDDGPDGLTSSVTFDATAGTTYWIAVDGQGDADGPTAGELHVSVDGAGEPPDTTPPDTTPPDTKPPATEPLTLSAKFGAPKLAAMLARGLAGTARCSRLCKIQATMIVDRAGAARLGLAKPAAIVSTASATGRAKADTRLVLKLTKAHAKRLAGAARLGVTVRVVARSGTSTKTVVRVLTLKR